MAIKIFEKFSPRANPSDADYPYGSIKNESVPGAQDGTPLDASWGNDMLGFTDALLNEAGITPNGLPDTVQSSQRLDSVKNIIQTLTKSSGTISYGGTTLENFLSKVAVGDDNNYQPRLLACAIRNTGSGWAFINDSSHEPIGFTGIETLLDGRIRLDHAVGAVEVGGLVVCTDETFARRGIIAGASVGLSSSYIDVSAILNFTVDIANASVTSDPMWDGDISAAISGGVCNVTHPECQGGDLPSISAVDTTNPSRTDITISYSSSQTNLVPTSNISGYMSYNGTNWVYTGDMTDIPTGAWDGVENEVVVNHVMSDTTDISINGRAAAHTAKPDSTSSTTFQVKFYDASNALVTTPDTDMKFFFSRKGYAKTNLRNGTFAIKRGYAKVDANKLISGSGNLWILGVQNT